MFIGFRWYGQYNKCRFRGRNLSRFGSTTAAFFGTGKETRAVVWKMGKKKQRMLEAFWNLIRIIWLSLAARWEKCMDQEWQMAGFSCGTGQLWQEIFISCRMPFKKMHGLDCIRMRVNILFCCYPTQNRHKTLLDNQHVAREVFLVFSSSILENTGSLGCSLTIVRFAATIDEKVLKKMAKLLEAKRAELVAHLPSYFTGWDKPAADYAAKPALQIHDIQHYIRRHSQAGPCSRRQNDSFAQLLVAVAGAVWACMMLNATACWIYVPWADWSRPMTFTGRPTSTRSRPSMPCYACLLLEGLALNYCRLGRIDDLAAAS